MNTSNLRAFTSVLALVWSGGALAQESPSQAPLAKPVQPTGESRDTESRSVADDALEMGDVVVIAQRRSENLQNVPMSVSSITQATLAQSAIVNSQDLSTITPGLSFARSSVNAQPTIRGIGTRNAAPGDEPNVASYIDGVYQAEQFNNFQEFTNIERVEVLKGPQGTLFGRNATGGAINIITRKPSFSPDAEVGFTYGSFNYAKATLYATGSLIDDVLAASISAYGLTEDNYYRNVFLNRRNGTSTAAAGRLKLLLTPSETVQVALNAAYAYSDSANVRNGTPINGNSFGRRFVNDPVNNPTGIPLDILVPTRPFTTATDIIPSSVVRQKQIDGHIDIDLGWANLSGLLSYSRSNNNVSPDDFDITPLYLSQLDQFYTNTGKNQELVLTSASGGALEWLVGVSGFQGSGSLFITTTARVPTVSRIVNDMTVKTQGYAGFAEATYNVLSGLYLTGGLRYTYDQKEAVNRSANVSGKRSWRNWSPRAIARYQFAPNSNVYISYTEGFKSGTFNPTTAAGVLQPAAPETVQSFEIGLKASLASNLRFNVAAYRSNYRDLQTSINIVQPNGGITTLLENADSARIKGLEAEMTWNATRNFRLNAGLALLDTKIGNFPNASAPFPIFNAAGQPIGNAGRTVDVSGNNLLRSPKYTVNIGANYTTDIARGKLTLAANAFFSARYYADLTNRLRQPAYEVINLSATYAFPDSRASITAFVQNLTDSRYAMSFSTNLYGDNVQLMKPRWFGATLSFGF